MERLRHVVGALFVLCLLPAAALAAPSAAEIVTFGESLAPGLLRVPLDGEVRVDDWPVAPGERAAVVLTRFDVYAPDARIWKVENGRQTEVPRSKLAFFRGRAENDPDIRLFVAVDPDQRTLSGFTTTPEGVQEIRPLRETQAQALATEYVVGTAEPLLAGKDGETAWTCGQNDAPLEFLEHKAEASTTQPIFAEAITSLHTATIAVDTDNELINNKFGGNATTATNYIASLFASMTVIYERDLLVRLLQGTTFLRTTADPFTSTGSTYDKLIEFGNYWSANHGGVNRAAAAMLSARGGSGAAGIAWLNVLCSKTHGYSYTQLYTTGTTLRTGEIMVVAHEIGHNFGSPHSHCYNPPLDNCYNAESGCYTGTKTCPAPVTINGVAGVTGTLMSYCHLGGIGCATANVFHPGSVALLQPKIQAAVNSCIFPAGTPTAPTVSTVSPASGPAAGGTNVTITGANFQSGATVSFGGTASPQVTFNSATQLTARTPARAVGAVTVTVTNPGGLSGSKANAFTFVANSPSISSIGPASGTTAGGTVITITGADFQNGAVVAFGGVAAPSVTFNSSTRLTVTTPAHATGKVAVAVFNPDQKGAAKDPGYFYATPSTATDFYTVTPCRMLDTRNANGTWGGPVLGASAERTFPFINRCGIPANAKAVVANVTVTGPTAAGYLTVFPGNAFDLGTTALNYLTGVVRSNNAILPLSTDGAGTVGLRNNGTGTTHVVVDVTGYYVN
jgi:hypothetical protein